MLVHPENTASIILNYNGADDTIACLRSLYSLNEVPFPIIVVDNHSTDTSCSTVLQAWRQWADPVVTSGVPVLPTTRAVFLQLSVNNGYAAGNNAGIRCALSYPSCQAVWVLNNDTEVRSDTLTGLCGCLNAHPEAALTGATLVFAHARNLVQCAAGFSINRYCGTTPAVCGHGALDDVLRLPVAEVARKLNYLCGASMLIRREVFDRIGLFREDYFLYYEDTEFCLRAQRAGFLLAWAPSSIVYHKEGSSTGAESAAEGRAFSRPAWVDYLALRNRIYMMRKHYPWALPVVAASYLGVMLNRIRRGQANRIPLIFRAAWDGLRGHMGKPDHLFPALRDVHENPGH